MAKKKSEFDNVVEESFNEGYQSEPEVDNNQKAETETKEAPPAPEPTKIFSENELRLRSIVAGEAETLEEIWGKEDRSTYYLTDVHRACIDIIAHEEGIKKNDVVVAALNKYFSDAIKQAAKDRVVTIAIKKLEREIQKENN